MKNTTAMVLVRDAVQSGSNEPVDAVAGPETPAPEMIGAICDRMTIRG